MRRGNQFRPVPVRLGRTGEVMPQRTPMGTSTLVLICCGWFVAAAVAFALLMRMLDGWVWSQMD